MQAEFFQKQIERLRGVYSPTSLNHERVDVLWQRFKHVPENQFHGAVTFLIGEFTTQALPAVSRFEEAVARFKSQQSQAPKDYTAAETSYLCPPCRDFGYGWIGDTVVRCVCENGRTLHPEELLKAQKSYDNGKKFMPTIKAMIGAQA